MSEVCIVVFLKKEILCLHFTYLNKLDYNHDKALKNDETPKTRFNNGILKLYLLKGRIKTKGKQINSMSNFIYTGSRIKDELSYVHGILLQD